MGGYSAAGVKLDLHGSIQQQGFTSLRHDYAVRRCIVRGLNNDNDSLGVAIRRCFQDPDVGLFHHNLYLLPLTKVRAVKWGPHKAKVQLIYQRNRFSTPPIPAVDTASTYGAYEYVPVFRIPFFPQNPETQLYDKGLPAGDWHKLADPNNREKPPIAYRFRRPVVRIVYNTVLSFNPFAMVEQYLNKINSEPLKIGNVQFVANTLRFDYPNSEAGQIFKGSGIGTLPRPGQTFAVQYQFTANPDGHYRQYAYWDNDLGTWDTQNILGYEATEFVASDFPAHP
jgi:hypothetical protein